MKEYHKIQTVFKRDATNNNKTLIIGDYALPEFAYLSQNTWSFTEKVDGTNIRVMYHLNGIEFGGRTDEAQIPNLLLSRLDEKFKPLVDAFHALFGDTPTCLYGEGYGAKIQKGGGNYRSDQGFVLFDIRVGEWWLLRADVEDVAKRLDIAVVPIIGEGTLVDMVKMAEAGFVSKWGNFMAEGIVARTKEELRARNGERIITKVKYKDFRR